MTSTEVIKDLVTSMDRQGFVPPSFTSALNYLHRQRPKNEAYYRAWLQSDMGRLWIDRTFAAEQPCNLPASVQKLIADNHDAPADTIIRALFEHFTFIRDDEDGLEIASAEDALALWYNVDELTLVFDRKERKTRNCNSATCDYFIKLIHQGHVSKPSIEDVSDYMLTLEKTAIGPLLNEDAYDGIYR